MIEKHYNPEVNLAEMLTDASIDRVMAIDKDWKIIAWNHTNEIISGIKKAEAIGRPLMEIFPQILEDDEMTTAYERAMQGKKSYLPAKEKVFNRSHYENHIIPLQDDEGHVFGSMTIMHDVAHRIKAERQLQQLNTQLKEKYRQLEKANAEMATFTSITGNELKEPLKKVYTSLEMVIMNDAARLSDSSKAGLRRMQASLNRVKLLLEDIVALSSFSSASRDFSPVDLNEVAKSVQVSLRNKIREKQASIELESLPAVMGSEQMLHNLLYNLLDNGIKFQAYGNQPRVRISASMTRGEGEQEYNCISVSDNGIGFDQSEAENVFNMFVKLHDRTEYHGSGIGLTICRKIVENHGGYIEAESKPGKGTTIRCFLPM